MQPIFLIFLLLAANGNFDLQKFLAFYRENRALFAALTGSAPLPDSNGMPMAGMPQANFSDGRAPCAEGAETAENKENAERAQKSRPAGDGFRKDILEEYLARATAR